MSVYRDPYLASSREAKRRRTGICRVCGGITRYNGHGLAVSTICHVCSSRAVGRARRGTGRVNEIILSRLARGPARFTEIEQLIGYQPMEPLARLRRHGLIERISRGVYRLAVQAVSEGAASLREEASR